MQSCFGWTGGSFHLVLVGEVGLFILVKLLTVLYFQFGVVVGCIWKSGCFCLNQVKPEKTDTKIYRFLIALWRQICAQRGRLLKEIEMRLSSFSEGQLEGSMETLKTSSKVEKDLIFCLLMYEYLLEAAIAWYSITNVNEKVSVRNVQNDSCYQHLAKTINFLEHEQLCLNPFGFCSSG